MTKTGLSKNMQLADCGEIEKQIIAFIKKNAPANGVVLGVSGGIDSALVLILCVKALGEKKVNTLLMPETDTGVDSTIKNYLEELRVKTETVPIKPIFDAYQKHGGVKKDRLIAGNLKARIRMSLLYSRSNAKGLVVMGTGNRSELLAGYFTRYGDGGVDNLPIGDLYKTQVRELAHYEKIPEKIITQAPSAGLWNGQTDEQELGITYATLDLILYAHTEKGIPFRNITIEGVSKADIQLVEQRFNANSFKLTSPPVCQLKK